jgi:hypothetical protein
VVVGGRRGERAAADLVIARDTARATPLTARTGPALAPAFGPDGRRIAFFAPDSADRTQLWVMAVDSADAAPVRLTDHADVTPTRARWTRDGRWLVYGANGRLWRVPSGGGTPVEIPFTAALSFQRPRHVLPPARFPEPGTTQQVRGFMGLALSPDAESVGMLALGRLWVMPVGGAPFAVADVPVDAHHLAWSPDGRTLAWSAGRWQQEDLYATDLATGATRRVTALPGREDHPMYAPDGMHLAFMHGPSEDSTILRIVDVRAREVSDPARALAVERGADAAWSPSSDGLLLLSGGFAPGKPSRAEVVLLSGRRRAVSGTPDSPLFPKWTVEGLVFVRHARLWRARFDGTGSLAPAEPLGAARQSTLRSRAMAPSSSLRGGLRLRPPIAGSAASDGRSYHPPVAEPVLIRNARIIAAPARRSPPPRT